MHLLNHQQLVFNEAIIAFRTSPRHEVLAKRFGGGCGTAVLVLGLRWRVGSHTGEFHAVDVLHLDCSKILLSAGICGIIES